MAWVKLLGWMNVQSGVRINGVGRRGLGWSVEISSHGSTLSRQHTVHRPGQGSTDIRHTHSVTAAYKPERGEKIGNFRGK